MGTVKLAVVAWGVLLVVPAAAQTSEVAAQSDRAPLARQLEVMEVALAQAVNRSARVVEQQLPSFAPGVVLFAGPTQVRGFRLDDYGVFFDVEYPVLRRSILWSMQMLESDMDATLLLLRRRIEEVGGIPSLDQAFRQIERGVSPTPSPVGPVSPVGLATPPFPGDARRYASGGDAPRAPAPSREAAPPFDPQQVYQDALRSALTDAVVRFGDALGSLLGDDEWLTVTARDVRGLRGQDSTVRIRARDLVALSEGRLSLEEARSRVEASAF